LLQIAANRQRDMETASIEFEAVHREFHPKILRYLSKMAGPQEAPDLTQIAMFKVSEHLSRFRGESSLATWIYRIATNVAIDAARRTDPQIDSLDVLLANEQEQGLPSALQSESAENRAARTQMSACVREFVGRLPAHYRAVLILSDVEGLSNAEVADVLGVSLEAAKIRLHRARASLRRDLAAGCTVYTDGESEVACERRAAAP
jgi:RNA polymerase sigma-70 factor, ECF subfamily